MKMNLSLRLSILTSIIASLLFISCAKKNMLQDKSLLQVEDLRSEYKKNTLGIDNVNPRLSWKLVTDVKNRGEKQTAYQILVASSLSNLQNNVADIWDSKKVSSNKSVNVLYNGKKLVSAKKYFWKVKIWNKKDVASNWSSPSEFSTGLLKQSDWKGDWIMKEDQDKIDHNWYRKNFTLQEDAKSAFVFVASLGYHELYVNGEKITENYMNPASSYMKKRIPYLSYDVADKLKKGKNTIAVWHAAGWTRWRRITEYRNIPFVFKAQAEIETTSKNITLTSDTSWKTKKSYSEYLGDWDIFRFGGETIDDRKREDNWSSSDYNDSSWVNAVVYNPEELNKKIPPGKNISWAANRVIDHKTRALFKPIKAELSSQMVEPQVKFREVETVSVTKNREGNYVFDMGENYTGFFEINLHSGKEGQEVLFEISDKKGEPSGYSQKSKYIYNKTGKGKFSNRFNVAGGRWVTVYGLTYMPKKEDAKGYLVTNNRKQISQFESSNTLLNKIYQVNINTYLANTMDGILVDCPHRERRGWGEVTVAAMYGDALPNFESGAYMDQYLQYTRDAQYDDGRIRAIINEEDRQFLMWKANSPITVLETYKTYGDKKVLRDNYESMLKWMDWLYKKSNAETGGALKAGENGTRQFPGLGDWSTPKGSFWSSSNSPESIHFNNCLYAYMLENALEIAQHLNEEEDIELFKKRLEIQRKATHEKSYNPETGKYVEGNQVSQAFALLSGVTPSSEKQKVYNNLVDKVLYKFPYYDTGSSGQALYTRYFIESGERMDLIYELLKDKRHPSYGYFIEKGMTAWPEYWSADSTSRIHTCYTGIGGYFIKGFGGIRPDPENWGMQNMIIKPAIVGDLTYANTSYESMYGDVVVNWKKDNEKAFLHIKIPVNTSAKVYIPAKDKNAVKEGSKLAKNSKGIKYIGSEKSDAVGNYIVFEVLSGVYDFEVTELPVVTYPEPIGNPDNLSTIARMNSSSMKIASGTLPLFEAFRANDEDIKTSWKARGKKNEWLEIEWITPQVFNEIHIDEVSKSITSYKIQYLENDVWKDIKKGTFCGKDRVFKFESVTSNKCRIFINDAKAAPSITEFKVFNKK